MSFLKIGDRAAGAIKSGGTTRRAAKMVCLDLDHPDIETVRQLEGPRGAEGGLPGRGHQAHPRRPAGAGQAARPQARPRLQRRGLLHRLRPEQQQLRPYPQRLPQSRGRRTAIGTSTIALNGKVAKTVKARALWDDIAFAAWRCADPGVQYDGTINQWHTCPTSGRINASNPCVTGDTRVLTPGGIWRRIDQMIHLPARIVTNLDARRSTSPRAASPPAPRTCSSSAPPAGTRSS